MIEEETKKKHIFLTVLLFADTTKKKKFLLHNKWVHNGKTPKHLNLTVYFTKTKTNSENALCENEVIC